MSQLNIKQLESRLADGIKHPKKEFRLALSYRVSVLGPCWVVATYSKVHQGYTKITFNKWRDYTHRVVAQLYYGEIPEGLIVSHLCEVVGDIGSRSCVNPSHLVLETQQNNVLRSPTRANRYQQMRAARAARKLQKLDAALPAARV